MFRSLEESVQQIEDESSSRERWRRYIGAFVLTLFIFGVLFSAIMFLE